MTIIEKEFCQFYARTDKGFAFKVTIDIMKNLLNKHLYVKINKKGFFSSQGSGDPSKHKLYNYLKAFYTAETWNAFICTKERTIDLNLVELCNICKNIKKKFHLLLYIRNDEPNRLYIVPIPPNQTSEDHSHLARRLPITDITLDFSTFRQEINYKYHNGLSSQLFHSMCKNFSGARCSLFTFLMYPSGRIYCTSEGTFSDCLFENGKGTIEEREHEVKYKRYIENSYGRTDDDIDDNVDDAELLQSFSFYTGSFNSKFLKDIQKINGYGSTVHIYADPIDRDNEITPSRPLCFVCTAPDSFILEIYVKSNEQIEHEKD